MENGKFLSKVNPESNEIKVNPESNEIKVNPQKSQKLIPSRMKCDPVSDFVFRREGDKVDRSIKDQT
jgi:hypothetical protein